MKDFFFPMWKHPTVFQLPSLNATAKKLFWLGFKGKSISIFSYIQAAIRALSSQEFSSKLVWECGRLYNAEVEPSKTDLWSY